MEQTIVTCEKCGHNEFNRITKYLIRISLEDYDEEELYGVNDSKEYYCAKCNHQLDNNNN